MQIFKILILPVYLILQFSNLRPISNITLMKYVHLVTKEVQQLISQKLPDKFAIALDGWSAFSTYYVGSIWQFFRGEWISEELTFLFAPIK